MNDLSHIKPQILRAAEIAELLLQPVSLEACHLVETLAGEVAEHQFAAGHRKRKHKEGAYQRFVSSVGALLGDLLVAARNTEAEGFCWRLSRRVLFKYTRAESRAYDDLKRDLTALGYLEIYIGNRYKDDFDGEEYYPDSERTNWAERLRATGKLLSLCADSGISPENAHKHFKRDQELSVPVVLKATKKGDKEGKELPLPASPRLDQLQEEVREINSYLEDQYFSFGPAPYLYRLFNNGDAPDFNWNYGGRFYTKGKTYLGLPPEERRSILINGSKTVSLDVTACQLTILSGLVGFELDLSKDPYQIEGVKRDKVKNAVNIIIGLGSVSPAGKLQSPKNDYERIQAKAAEHLPVLEMLHSHGLNSLTLQTVDANIMAETLLELKRVHDVPALPVHDCLIVSEEDAVVAKSVFERVFKKHAKVTPRIVQE